MTTKPPVKDHEHEWVQERVTLWTSPVKATPVPGATVLWRCSRRGCDALRTSEHRFRRPNRRQLPNAFRSDPAGFWYADSPQPAPTRRSQP